MLNLEPIKERIDAAMSKPWEGRVVVIQDAPAMVDEIENLRGVLRRWLKWLRDSGPEGSNQWEKFDKIRRDTEESLGES